ncbi:uncharacterized protein PV06_03566 [Exophiala oligosperma]|uniref:HECT-type E3 ubiquitin transferase n=1 Tax=Exophiala oligosperma TaxID=215243 RepID=A0A0D2EAZ5_9EURO|nr:uncharacterized protein PV06_03566 [Exophiala oligosperma]KIW45159.1 hypothetical protein PV06_03566 [Exophiala oligosperma]
MGKVTRKPQEKHKVSLSPAVSDLVQKVSTVPLADLPALFSGWSQRWPYPRGDLNNWIEPLDRFDSILQSFNAKYGLDKGPQTTSFGISLLLEQSPGTDEKRLKELGFGPEGDRELVEAILVFSKLLVEKCANRTVYNSTDRLNDLLNTTSLSLLHTTLRITFYLAQRFADRSLGSRPSAGKFYDFDHERLQKLAAPLGQLLPSSKRGTLSPVKTTKSKEKGSHVTKARRSSATVSPSDFRSLCKDASNHKDGGKTAFVPDREWQTWAYVKVTWSSQSSEKYSIATEDSSDLPDAPSTPTPARRSSGLSRLDTNSPPNAHSPEKVGGRQKAEGDLHCVEFTYTELASTSIESILRDQPEEMPANSRYELLHQLRVAYGLVTSAKTRKELLAIRLLAIMSLANVFNDEVDFSQKVFPSEQGMHKPHELIQQLVSLAHDAKKGQSSVSLYLQTLAMETMTYLAHFKSFGSEINTALGAGSSQGLLSQLILKGLHDIAKDHDSTDTPVGDEWREAIFSMPRTLIEVAGHHGRSSEAVIATTFITTYLSGFDITSGKALRVHLQMLDFIKMFFHHFKDGLTTLLANNAYEHISNLLSKLVHNAWSMLQDGEGIPVQYKTRVTDYEIPYMHQQIIRSIIDMINDISTHQGAQADRVLRSLVDSQALLRAFRLVTDHLTAFGAHTWSEVVKAICGFLHNEPTSYTVISEAGIIQSLLETVTVGQKPEDGRNPRSVSSRPENRPQGIPPVQDAIVNVSQAFGAICLTNAGFDHFKASGVLEKFFEIFESPAHVKVLTDANVFALLGSTFDELIRHHPNMRNAVMSAVIVMMSRVRHISRALSVDFGAGPKLWLPSQEPLAPCGGREALSLEIAPPPVSEDGITPPPRVLELPNDNKLTVEDSILPPSIVSEAPRDQDNNGLKANDYVRPAVGFLATFFENQSLCNIFLEHGACDLVLDLVTLPSLPVSNEPFDRITGMFQEVATAVHMMAECKPHIVLPTLLDRARFACSELRHFAQCQPKDWSSYFGKLVNPNPASSEIPSPSQGVETTGTQVVRALMTVFSIAQVLAEVFNAPMYNTRSTQNLLFSQVNLADILAEIVKAMGGISAACYREDIAIQLDIPAGWALETRPENFSTGDDEVDKILSVRGNGIQIHNDQASNSPENDTTTAVNNAQLAKDKQTAAFKNLQTLRYLLVETPAAITEFLCRLGRGITGRRRPDTFARQKNAMAARALATAYLTELHPYFLNPVATEEHVTSRFTYLVIALDNIRRSFFDDSHPTSGPISLPARQSFVIEAFRDAGGVKSLTSIGTEFFDKLKSCKVEEFMFSANTGLKICLDILDEFTNSKNIMDSAQSNTMKMTDPSKQVWFVPGQVLVNLRTEAIPLTKLIWESEYADQASNDVVQKLISILNHIQTADHETEAIRDRKSIPKLESFSPRKLSIDLQRINYLKDKGYDESLAREALYRVNPTLNSSNTPAEEYCKAFKSNPWRRRLPIPTQEGNLPATTNDTPSISSPISNPLAAALMGSPATGAIEAALAEVANNASASYEMEDVLPSEPQASSGSASIGNSGPATSSAMDLSNILNDDGAAQERQSKHLSPPSPDVPLSAPYTVEELTRLRHELRDDLPERCINILHNHPNLTFELSDLIFSASKASKEGHEQFWTAVIEVLLGGLLSNQFDKDSKEGGNEATGKKVSASAHLIALLIQGGEVLDSTLNVFQESFDGLLSFLRLPASDGRTTDESFPWIAPVLLIVEKMLSRDSEPAQVKWNTPNDLETSSRAELVPGNVLDYEVKQELFDILVNMLPRVGKDQNMALAVTRVLVILTRSRDIATRLAEKRNLQRLFLMVKQLVNGVNHRLQSSFMTILRHIVEDDDTVKQIMRSEIKALFNSRSPRNQLDTAAYTRELYYLVLRSPELFVEVTNEMVKLASWTPHGSGAINLVLRESEASKSKEQNKDGQPQPTKENEDVSMRPAATAEVIDDSLEPRNKTKISEARPPIIENPDGVIHFILSEMLTYRNVEDKEPPAESATKPEQSPDESSPQETPEVSTPLPQAPSKAEKPKFKLVEHPIFSYRCFLMYSLSELLHCYNRTKVEFITFNQKADPKAATPSKPRANVLNYFLDSLIPSGYVDKEDSLVFKKKSLTSEWAIKVIVALCSKTGEFGAIAPSPRYSAPPQVDDANDEPELQYVRRFALEHAMKSYKDAISSSDSRQAKYSKLLCLADMFNRLLTKPAVPDGSAGSQNPSYKALARMMFEKNLTAVLTSSLAEIDLSFPGSKRVVKFILRPLQELTALATTLSLTEPDFVNSVSSSTEEDLISSASSVSDVEEYREDTPDLFSNSALGMLDGDHESDSDSEDEEEEDDEEMYEEEYDDEMEYDDGVGGPNDDEAVSDEELDNDMPPEGEIEGLPGDVPMDIEFVVNNPHMDIDTDDENEDGEDDEDTDDEEDDDDDEEIMVEEDDDVHGGEITGDDENDSLNDIHGDEGEWEDEEDDEDGDSEVEEQEIRFDADEMPLEGHGDPSDQGVISDLLRVLEHHDMEEPSGHTHHIPADLIVPAADNGDPDDEDEDDEDVEDADEMDENDDMDYGDFDNFLADAGADGERVIWEAHFPHARPRSRHFRNSTHLSSFMGRRIGGREDLMAMGRPGRLSQHGRPGMDDGTNPLLRRPQQDHSHSRRIDLLGPNFLVAPGMDTVSGMPGFPLFGATPLQAIIRQGDTIETGSHGGMIEDLLMRVGLHRDNRDAEGRIQFQLTGPLPDIQNVLRPATSGMAPRHHGRENSIRLHNFVPALTMTRWQEEARLLFGNTYVDKVQRVQVLITSLLVPLAQEEEKERRRKREEEQKAEREEMERRRLEEERRQKEEEEREAAAKAEEERLRAEEAITAARGQDESISDHDDGDTEPMEDVQGTETRLPEQPAEGERSQSQPRVYFNIRGRELDITGLDIDTDYLEALPEELREEVVMQQYALRRDQAREQGDESTVIDPDFLNALPEEIREELRQQEAHAQRRREREAARRQAAGGAGAMPQVEEMDNDTFLATLDPAFRRVILAEQPPEILRQLDPRHAAEGRAHARRLFHYPNVGDREGRDGRGPGDGAQRDNKRFIVQMVDKSGVATLLRLMFIPQQGSLRTNLWHILRNICGNRQTRFEVINLLLVVLKEGSTDVGAVERSLANLSLRAKAPQGQKTPQPLKRTLSVQPGGGLAENVTPLVVVQQCLSALQQLCQNSVHTRTIFLREIDVSQSSKKGKEKAKSTKTVKYPLNDLIGLLDRKLIVESSSCLQFLAELLSSVTKPLAVLLRKDKEEKTSEDGEPAQKDQTNEPPASVEQAHDPQSGEVRDVEIRDAPAMTPANNEPTTGSAAIPQTQTPDLNDDLNSEEAKSKKPFEPPAISEHNLQLIVRIFVAPECNSDTFHSTLETLWSLSCIPNTAVVFSKELISHVKHLSQSIWTDLEELLPQLKDAQSITDLQAVSSIKFSHGGSDQVKLLRVLQALDYLSAAKTDAEGTDDKSVSKSILTTSYDTLSLRPLWNKLSECLTTIQDKDNITGFATMLLPLIESLMVVCKNTSLKDSALARQVREQLPGSPAPETMDEVQELFFNFTTEHRKILNDIIRQSPRLMQGNGSFSLLVKNSKVLDFDNKRTYFTKQIHSRLHQQRHIQPPLQLNVRRDQVFQDSYKALYYKTADEMKYGKLNIRFNGEEGVDAGGVSREWFQVLARGMFNPDWALWQPVASDRTTFHPNPLSWINGEHLLYFKFIGRIIGKALHEGRVLDAHFSRAVYKRLLGKEPNLKDLESMDLDYYKSLVWILENDITDVITEDFSVIEEQFGEEKVVDLIPNGRNIPVTDENKREYVNAQVRYRLTTSVSEQLENFVRGFHDIIPAELVAIFDEQELELLISGLPEVDVDDWRAHTEYHNYTANSAQITWFWRIVRGMSNEERAKLLQFVTGTSKVPLNGFKDLEGMQGNTLFSIHKDPSQNRLPTSHTCFNQLDLPAYDDYDTLKSSLMTAINLGADYFGFA